MKIYLDSNIIVSLLKQELGYNYRPLFIEVEDFLTKTKKEKHILCISELFLNETSKVTHTTKEDIISFLKETKNEIMFCKNPPQEDFQKIKNLGIHGSDAYHAATALENNCDCIITFNLKDFEPARRLIKIIEPNEL